jgi:hypothetical protein
VRSRQTKTDRAPAEILFLRTLVGKNGAIGAKIIGTDTLKSPPKRYRADMDAGTSIVPVVVLVRDLMFSGRISAEARAVGKAVKLVREPAKLAEVPGTLLIVDLNLENALEAAAGWRDAEAGRTVVAFVAHTDAPRIAAARGAGIEQVMPRSRFVEVLPAILSEAR